MAHTEHDDEEALENQGASGQGALGSEEAIADQTVANEAQGAMRAQRARKNVPS